ncbi:ComEA family DNA-binding protein [Aliiglaciecola sp. CAU 1673]|uniref:ComEA family DNA-binding protein n=1 Tax=Aliiglaciecola sp. CAU 1673 TaxID=3032595 RepID=UPI0023D97B29|nr:ComEA family DNA-binding protein [Aliiglaciecola sp. CAU 1673]MDF2179646.1 ComEA family DNA-binding protein [Aliiglaciecola sp. CAU 1673]
MKRLLMLSAVLLGLSTPIQALTEQEPQGEPAASSQIATININEASAEELTALPGIGKVKAEAIVNYREEHGPFEDVDDLTKVNGIGEQTVKGLKSKVSFH